VSSPNGLQKHEGLQITQAVFQCKLAAQPSTLSAFAALASLLKIELFSFFLFSLQPRGLPFLFSVSTMSEGSIDGRTVARTVATQGFHANNPAEEDSISATSSERALGLKPPKQATTDPCLEAFVDQAVLLVQTDVAEAANDMVGQAPLVSAGALEVVGPRVFPQLGLFGCLQDEAGTLKERRLFLNLSK
jgi:hypothetical protein